MGASLPDGWAETDRWELGRMPRWLGAALALLTLPAFAAAAWAGLAVVALRRGEAALALDFGGALAGLALGVALHELAHAAAFRALDGRPRFGARLRTRLGPVLYVAAPGCYFGRGAYLAATLAPLGGLTAALWLVLFLAPADGALASAALVAAAANAGGSAGDAAIALAVLRRPAGARFEDTGDGFAVWGPPPAAPS